MASRHVRQERSLVLSWSVRGTAQRNDTLKRVGTTPESPFLFTVGVQDTSRKGVNS